MGKRISIGIVIGISFLALFSLFTSGPVVRAQTQVNSRLSNHLSIYRTSTENNAKAKRSVTVTVTTTASAATTWTKTWGSSSANYGDYSISFNPPYWLCSDVSVTFTGPLVESGHYGDALEFQYFQYDPSYPSVLVPIFTDSGLTVTSDTVNYWISYIEYAQVNFAYQPNIAVKVVDVTRSSNGYWSGLIFMDLTNVIPESLQSCTYPAAAPAPEFQVQWLVIVASIVLSLVALKIRKQHRLN